MGVTGQVLLATLLILFARTLLYPRRSALSAVCEGSLETANPADTVISAIMALESNGFTVTQEADLIVARAGNTRFAAEDPVAILVLVKLAETRRPWRADDEEIDVLSRFSL